MHDLRLEIKQVPHIRYTCLQNVIGKYIVLICDTTFDLNSEC